MITFANRILTNSTLACIPSLMSRTPKIRTTCHNLLYGTTLANICLSSGTLFKPLSIRMAIPGFSQRIVHCKVHNHSEVRNYSTTSETAVLVSPQSIQPKRLRGKDFFSGKSNQTQLYIHADPFPLSLHNKTLPTPLHINYKVLGRHAGIIGKQTISCSKDHPVILVAPSMSFNCEVDSWWRSFVGHGNEYAINLDKFTVICADNFGAPFGTTGTLHKKSGDGAIATGDTMVNDRWGSEFPQITPLDQANVNKVLLDHLKVEKLHAITGGSLGGMIGLWFAAEYPSMVDRLFVISTTAKTTPGTVSIRRSQRTAILRDPAYRNGSYTEAPKNGLTVAREIGMTNYRSRQEFNERFSWLPIVSYNCDENIESTPNCSKTNFGSPFHFNKEVFEVESYLNKRAQDFTNVYDANAYLLQSRAMDLMDLDQMHWPYPDQYNLINAINRIQAKTYIMGVKRDNLIPCEEQRTISNTLKAHGKFCIYDEIDSQYGHDTFLVDHALITPRFKAFLEVNF